MKYGVYLMKVLERVLNRRSDVRCKFLTCSLASCLAKENTDAIFIMRKFKRRHQVRKKNLYYNFVDLEKVFDRVQREVVKWALRKLDVDECLIRTVMAYREFHYS